MMWQKFASQGACSFQTVAELQAQMNDIDAALGQLCSEIVTIVSGAGPALLRVQALRTKPAEPGHKSVYECVNQIMHHWYCCAAAKHIIQHGYSDLRLLPTAVDNAPKGRTGYDIQGRSPEGIQIIGEVCCVSQGLWNGKIRKTYKKLSRDESGARRLIFYNCEAKSHYTAKKRPGAYFLTIASPSGDVRLACATDRRPLSGISPFQAGSAMVDVA
jgi:hypothetical protein